MDPARKRAGSDNTVQGDASAIASFPSCMVHRNGMPPKALEQLGPPTV
ncbi:MAG: hypothetical protein OJF49_000738 [Ktedonobacterales bacterium]|nr:MAG: hypothetical protein OJF49_000738 [Ktedonobacterales bacterium]